MDSNTGLADIETHPVTAHFDHEAYDFTPWLAKNMEHLEEILDIPLEIQEREASVGSYSADLLARSPEDGRTVVIENQFGNTNHKHLGQSLVYTAGTEADVVVWIAESFTDKHTSVLRWLNGRTDEQAAFFGIQMTLKQIESSPYGIEFTLIEQPDDWQLSLTGEGLTETEQAQKRFWEGFRSRAEERGWPSLVTRTPKPRASYAIAIGKSGVYLRPTARFQSNELVAQARFTDTEQEYAGIGRTEIEAAFNQVTATSPTRSITSTIPDDLQFIASEDGYDHIRLIRDEVELQQRNQWEEYYDWLIDTALLFNAVLANVFEGINDPP